MANFLQTIGNLFTGSGSPVVQGLEGLVISYVTSKIGGDPAGMISSIAVPATVLRIGNNLYSVGPIPVKYVGKAP